MQVFWRQHLFTEKKWFIYVVMLGRQDALGELVFNTTAFATGEKDDTKLVLADQRLMSVESDVERMIEGKMRQLIAYTLLAQFLSRYRVEPQDS